jgi:hypothetical protein
MQIYNSLKEPKTVFTSKYVGVCWNDRRKQWRSAISILGNKRILGYFDSEKTAALAYNEMAIRYGKPYNVIEEEKGT